MAKTHKVVFKLGVRGREKGRVKVRIFTKGKEIYHGEKYVRRIDAHETWDNFVRAIREDRVEEFDE